MTAGVLGVNKVEIGQVIHQLAVGFFGNIRVEGTVARLHVIGRNLHPLGHHKRNGAVGVTEDQKGVGLFFQDHFFRADQQLTQHFSKGRGVQVEEVIGLADPQVVKENLVQLVIIVLAGVNQHMVGVLFQGFDNGGQADDFRPGSKDSHYFHKGEKLKLGSSLIKSEIWKAENRK